MGAAGQLTVFGFRFKAPVVHTFRRGEHAPPCGRRSPHRGQSACAEKCARTLSLKGHSAGPVPASLAFRLRQALPRPGRGAAPRPGPPRRAIAVRREESCTSSLALRGRTAPLARGQHAVGAGRGFAPRFCSAACPAAAGRYAAGGPRLAGLWGARAGPASRRTAQRRAGATDPSWSGPDVAVWLGSAAPSAARHSGDGSGHGARRSTAYQRHSAGGLPRRHGGLAHTVASDATFGIAHSRGE